MYEKSIRKLLGEDPAVLTHSLRVFEVFGNESILFSTELAILSKEFGFYYLDENIVEAKKEGENVRLLGRLR